MYGCTSRKQRTRPPRYLKPPAPSALAIGTNVRPYIRKQRLSDDRQDVQMYLDAHNRMPEDK
jgi:hypothetical protein